MSQQQEALELKVLFFFSNAVMSSHNVTIAERKVFKGPAAAHLAFGFPGITGNINNRDNHRGRGGGLHQREVSSLYAGP